MSLTNLLVLVLRELNSVTKSVLVDRGMDIQRSIHAVCNIM